MDRLNKTPHVDTGAVQNLIYFPMTHLHHRNNTANAVTSRFKHTHAKQN